MRKYVVEFIGTFFLVFTVGCTALQRAALAPLAIAAVLMVMIYAGGHISGAHYNPAVTLAVFMRGRLNRNDVVPYMFFQVAGAMIAAFAAIYVTGIDNFQAGNVNVSQAFVGEFLFTFALAYVVLNAATAKGTAGNSFYGLAIGFTVFAGAVAVGGVLNPAVAIGAAMMGLLSWSSLLIYFIATFFGAALAAATFKWLNPLDA